MIKKGTDLYEAIANAIYAIFDDEIPLDDPTETIEMFIGNINYELKNLEEEENE